MTRWREPSKNEPCACGSTRAANQCCLRAGRWRPDPALISPRSPRTGKAVDGCYAAVLGDCDGKLSGEHYISAALLTVIGGDHVELTGARFFGSRGKKLSVARATANILCTRHNNDLSDLDDTATRFFRALVEVDEDFELEVPGKPSFRVFPGEDIERWMLKLLCGLSVAGAFESPDGRALRPEPVEALFGARSWPAGYSFFAAAAPTTGATAGRYFRTHPRWNTTGGLHGIGAEFGGFPFVLTGTPEAAWCARPDELVFAGNGREHAIALGWPGGRLKKTVRYELTGSIPPVHPSTLPRPH